MLWLVIGCSGYEGGWVAFPDTPPVSLETRFLKTPAHNPTPEQAFEVRSACPRVRRARATKESAGVWALEIEGDRLESVVRIEALLPANRLAEIKFKPPNPTLLIPVACADCEIVLAIERGGHPIACKGPGRSIRVEAGEPKVPASPS